MGEVVQVFPKSGRQILRMRLGCRQPRCVMWRNIIRAFVRVKMMRPKIQHRQLYTRDIRRISSDRKRCLSRARERLLPQSSQENSVLTAAATPSR